MNFLGRVFKRVKNRFDNVWNEKYPAWWHLVDLLGGFICAIICISFPEFRSDYSTWTLVGLFFAIVGLGYVFVFSFTYGIVRSRNAWTKKRK